MDHRYETQSRTDSETRIVSSKHDASDHSKIKRNILSKRIGLHCLLPENSSQDSKMPDSVLKRCKNVMSKLRRRICKEGQQIIPLLTKLWKRMESYGYRSGDGNGLLHLWKIEQRLDELEYKELMELVFDVQVMLNSAMQFYGYSYEVRSEARKVQDLFFDILKAVFPDTDFREARHALSSSQQPAAASCSSARHAVGDEARRQNLPHEIGSAPTVSRLGSAGGSGSDQRPGNDDSALHSGGLFSCRKNRRDRDQLLGKSNQSPLANGGAMAACGSVGWANPVKRLRTDASRRRPCHL